MEGQHPMTLILGQVTWTSFDLIFLLSFDPNFLISGTTISFSLRIPMWLLFFASKKLVPTKGVHNFCTVYALA